MIMRSEAPPGAPGKICFPERMGRRISGVGSSPAGGLGSAAPPTLRSPEEKSNKPHDDTVLFPINTSGVLKFFKK